MAAQLEALVVDQLSVVLPPLATVVGVADSVTTGGSGSVGGTTVTFTDCVAEPPAPVQVKAKDELAVSGPVEAFPDVALVPLQLPDAAQLIALVEVQDSVAKPPELTVDGAADSVTEGPGGALGGGSTPAVTVWPAVPPDPLHVKVYEVLAVSAPVDSAPSSVFWPLQPPDASQTEAFAEVQLSSAAARC